MEWTLSAMRYDGTSIKTPKNQQKAKAVMFYKYMKGL